MSQNLDLIVPYIVVGKWMFIPLKLTIIGVDPLATCQKGPIPEPNLDKAMEHHHVS